MLSFEANTLPIPKLHAYLLGAIAPRPIAFASTVDGQGKVNLSPYSFFNVFGSNPPTLVFSPSRRVRDNTNKHTLENLYEVPEVVINIVNYNMVEQTSLASTEYEKGVNEFVKAGFTEAASSLVKPPRVAESPAAFECRVKQIIETGTEGGAGNLVICEVLMVHIQENILDAQGNIDPFKLDAVARMGANWYCRANGEAIFEIEKPNSKKGIGIDQLPQHIRDSNLLTGNELARLANVAQIPSKEEVLAFKETEEARKLLSLNPNSAISRKEVIHQLAKDYLLKNDTLTAWKILLIED